MSDWEEFRDRLRTIHREWNHAEETIKAGEQINQRVNWASIKELRYAGRRIVESINLMDSENTEEAMRRLQDAEYNCYRARHDAIDAATSKIAIELENAARKLGHSAIHATYSDFQKMLNVLNEIRRKIRKSRGNREKRDEIYKDIEREDFEQLVDMYLAFQGSENIMLRFAKRERRNQFISYAVAVVSILISMVIGMIFK